MNTDTNTEIQMTVSAEINRGVFLIGRMCACCTQAAARHEVAITGPTGLPFPSFLVCDECATEITRPA